MTTKVTNKRDKSYITRPFKRTLKGWWQYASLFTCYLFLFQLSEAAVGCRAGPRFEPQSIHTVWRLLVSDVHPIMMEKSALASEGRRCTPHPLSTYYHYVQSCSVSSCWEGGCTPSISSLPYLYSVIWTPSLSTLLSELRCTLMSYPLHPTELFC
jgi:hypothetical protein